MAVKSQISLTNRWVLNGENLGAQVSMLNDPSFREFLDFHLLLIQVEAHLLPSDKFLHHLVFKYELDRWFSGDLYHQNSMPLERRAIESESAMADDMLQLLIVVLCEQSLISGDSEEELVTREMTHKLAVERSGLSYTNLQVAQLFNFRMRCMR
jgi:hypothetical protein